MARKKAITAKALQDIPALIPLARRIIYELERRVHYCCSDKKCTSREKRAACEQLLLRLPETPTTALTCELPCDLSHARVRRGLLAERSKSQGVDFALAHLALCGYV